MEEEEKARWSGLNVRAVERPAAMEEEEAPARVISTLVRSLTFLCERERERERERDVVYNALWRKMILFLVLQKKIRFGIKYARIYK